MTSGAFRYSMPDALFYNFSCSYSTSSAVALLRVLPWLFRESSRSYSASSAMVIFLPFANMSTVTHAFCTKSRLSVENAELIWVGKEVEVMSSTRWPYISLQIAKSTGFDIKTKRFRFSLCTQNIHKADLGILTDLM